MPCISYLILEDSERRVGDGGQVCPDNEGGLGDSPQAEMQALLGLCEDTIPNELSRY